MPKSAKITTKLTTENSNVMSLRLQKTLILIGVPAMAALGFYLHSGWILRLLG